MRINLPVTQKEHPFPAGRMLVSCTDAKGRITYANEAFVELSGYGYDELLGQPHNLIRHPDMPAEAFRDLWDTIALGHCWQGVVKNRRKNGDHYWVVANVTPVHAGRQVVGYMSVRGEPTREQVQACEALYARMRQEAERGRIVTALAGGRLVHRGPVGRLLDFARSQARRWGLDGLAGLGAMLGTGVLAMTTSPWIWLPAGWAAAVLVWWLSYARREHALTSVEMDAARLASGDLVHLPATGGADALGRLQLSLAQIRVNFRTAISDVRAEVAHVQSAAAEIAAGNQDLSARTEAHSSSLEQTAASMEQINGTVGNTAGHVQQGSQLATQSAEVAAQGRQQVEQVVAAMHRISESSKRVADIIQTIEGVAFQTNILALNAAVEAARAGETGRGFAVVASEVRSLAGRTGAAAKEIRELINEAVGRVSEGVQQTDAAQQSIQSAFQAAGEVKTVLNAIDSAAREQQLGISQVNEAVSHMDTLTQQNAALVEQLAASAQTLNGQVGVVMRAMRLFRLAEGEQVVAEMDAVALRTQAKGRVAQEQAEPAH